MKTLMKEGGIDEKELQVLAPTILIPFLRLMVESFAEKKVIFGTCAGLIIAAHYLPVLAHVELSYSN